MNRAMHLILAAAALGAATVAAAQDATTVQFAHGAALPDRIEVRTVTVPYDAARLDSKSTEKLFFRIRLAAEQACDIASNAVGYERWDEHACETAAVSEAIQQAGEPELREYYAGLRGSAMPEDGMRQDSTGPERR